MNRNIAKELEEISLTKEINLTPQILLDSFIDVVESRTTRRGYNVKRKIIKPLIPTLERFNLKTPLKNLKSKISKL
jgi:hypothetical protein